MTAAIAAAVLACLAITGGYFGLLLNVAGWAHDHGRPNSPAPVAEARRAYALGVRFGQWGDSHPGSALAVVFAVLLVPPGIAAMVTAQVIRTAAGLA